MTDRERRLMRALVRIAVVVESLRVAEFEAGTVREDLGRVVAKSSRSLRWVASRLNDELRRGPEGEGGR